MARRLKRRSSPRPPRFRWQRSEIHILLACLDYSLQQNLEFENAAIAHIAKRTGKQVTAKLIQSALKKETKDYGRAGPWTVQHLLSEGSAFLEGYCDADRENIREEISRIEPPQIRYWLRNTSVESTSRSRTLSLNRRQRSETSTLPNHSTAESVSSDVSLQRTNNAGLKSEVGKLRNLRERQDYIFTLSNRLSAAEYECARIQESAIKAAEYRDDVVMQRDLRYENSVLKGQLVQMTSQRRMITLASTGSLAPSIRTIWQELECMATDIEDACASVDITIPPAPTDLSTHGGQEVKHTESESWSLRVAHCSLDQLFELISTTDDSVSESHIMKAIIAAGFSELVFESNFPDLLAKESPMLDQYRKHLLAEAGPQTLQQLEVLAYKSVTSEKYFLFHILQTTAKNLAIKLSSALAHLISPNDDTIIGASEKDHDENPVASLFTETFIRALKLKQELALSGSKYRLVFFQPGELFNPDIMFRDGDGDSAFVPMGVLARKQATKGWPRRLSVEKGARIKLCLFPALYAKRKEEFHHG
ncbi:hypothetical protein N657DRAFT_636917 [Parathielavia appendiculata]|uniref:Uncharacterized protein n=1 Tax=Parathielavia appendiculata TaxID=2587402 RepID=A0AAN6TTM8_9PEZI|nr:hypothetical protein N657DRAFT_636917 [Parathielavia appendiculata]